MAVMPLLIVVAGHGLARLLRRVAPSRQ